MVAEAEGRTKEKAEVAKTAAVAAEEVAEHAREEPKKNETA